MVSKSIADEQIAYFAVGGGSGVSESVAVTSLPPLPAGTNTIGSVNTAPAAPSTILNQAATSPVASGVSGALSTTNVSTLAVDVNLTAIVGGTAPTVTFYVDRQGVDGNWYRVWTGSALAAAGTSSTSIGPGLATNAVLTSNVRLGYIFGGTTVATSITYTASIVGR